MPCNQTLSLQVWFSHKRRKDKKSQQITAPAAPAAQANGSSGTSATPAATIPQASPPVSVGTDAAAAPTAAQIPLASLPSFTTYADKQAVPSQLPAVTTATQQPPLPPVPKILAAPEQPVQLPASLQLPYAHLDGTSPLPHHSLPAGAQQTLYRGPAAEPAVKPHTQTVFRPEAHLPMHAEALSQASIHPNAHPRQFLPNRFPPQSFMAAQQNARVGPGGAVSSFQPSVSVQPSPARPALIHMPSHLSTPAAAPSSAAAMPSTWLAAQSSPHVSEAHHPSPAVGHTPEADYTNDSRPEPMHEDSDAGTDDFEAAPGSYGAYADWRELVECAKSALPVIYREDGPHLSFVFDDPPSPDGNDEDDPDAPVKRKRVMVDGYEMEDDGEDGMNVSPPRPQHLCKFA